MTTNEMLEISGRSADYQTILREAVAIKFLIFINGGMATKTAVEDVLMMRFSFLDRSSAHSIMNEVERRGLDEGSIRSRCWRFDETAVPELSDYPEIETAKIRWYRGAPCFS